VRAFSCAYCRLQLDRGIRHPSRYIDIVIGGVPISRHLLLFCSPACRNRFAPGARREPWQGNLIAAASVWSKNLRQPVTRGS